jgi:hypothetical protein
MLTLHFAVGSFAAGQFGGQGRVRAACAPAGISIISPSRRE